MDDSRVRALEGTSGQTMSTATQAAPTHLIREPNRQHYKRIPSIHTRVSATNSSPTYPSYSAVMRVASFTASSDTGITLGHFFAFVAPCVDIVASPA